MRKTNKKTTDSKSVGSAELLAIFGTGLQEKVKRACTDRQEIERRWVEDMRQYMGQYSKEVLSGMPEGGSKVFVNLTRPKTDKGESQLVDMLFPADDKNYGISPTPNADLASAAESNNPVYDRDGNALQFADDKEPVTEGDVAKANMEAAEEAAKLMEREIDDQLIECDYSASSRKAIHYAALLGTGVLCGPEVELREQSSWTKDETGKYVAAFKVDRRPVVRHVATWDFFPDMSASTIQECNHILERSYMSKKTLRNMRRIPGVLKENLDKLLQENEEGGKATQNFSEHVSELREMSGIIDMATDNRFEVWRYRGPISKDILVSANVIKGDDESAPPEMDGIVIFCGDKVLKAAINPMETEEWPYSVFCWNKDDNCIFGTGIPRHGAQQQAMINTSMRLMLDNATKAAGPQIVRNNKIKPDDNSYTITPWKTWTTNDAVMKVTDAFQIFTFPSFQNEIANIYNLAKAQLDEVTDLPAISQGEQGQVTPTVGGMSMLMNAASSNRRNQVKHFDDDVTVPLIKRFYDWNMQFSPNDAIKGDMQVHARGTSALLAKEQNSQALFNILNNYVGHPVLSKFFKDEGLDAFRKAIQSLHINPDDIVKDHAEYVADMKAQQEAAAEAGEPQDPRIYAEQLRGENRMRELEFESQMHNKNNQLAYEIARMKTQGDLARLANDKDISLASLDADLKKAGWKMDLDASMFKTEVQIKQLEGMTANYGLNQK